MEGIKDGGAQLGLSLHDAIEEALGTTRLAFNFNEKSKRNMNLEVLRERLETYAMEEGGIIKQECLDGLSSLWALMTSVGDSATRWKRMIAIARSKIFSADWKMQNTPMPQ